MSLLLAALLPQQSLTSRRFLLAMGNQTAFYLQLMLSLLQAWLPQSSLTSCQ